MFAYRTIRPERNHCVNISSFRIKSRISIFILRIRPSGHDIYPQSRNSSVWSHYAHWTPEIYWYNNILIAAIYLFYGARDLCKYASADAATFIVRFQIYKDVKRVQELYDRKRVQREQLYRPALANVEDIICNGRRFLFAYAHYNFYTGYITETSFDRYWKKYLYIENI